MKLVLPIVVAALVLGLLFPRINTRVWMAMSAVIIAVIALFYLRS